MRFGHAGLSLWYGTPDAPAPGQAVQGQDRFAITIGVQPPNASNIIKVRYRVNGGQEHTEPVTLLRHDSYNKAQYFTANLPPAGLATFQPGDTVEYSAVCYCAGRQVPSKDEEGRFATFRVRGTPTETISNLTVRATPPPEAPATSRLPAAPTRGAIDAGLGSPRRAFVDMGVAVHQPYARASFVPLPVQQTEVTIEPDHAPGLVVRVPSPAAPQPPSPRLDELATSIRLNVPTKLLTALAIRGIRTLGDIRSAGGIGDFDGVAADNAALRSLEAHADLSRLSPDVHVNAALIEKGYTSALAIATASRETFVAAARDALGEAGASQLHVAARTQVNVLNNLLTGRMLEPVVGEVSETGSPKGGGRRPCACDACQAAASPAAYLADLLDYAVKHLNTGGAAITVDFLTKIFHQPFGELPTSCDAVERRVRQVRICIEVLRSYLDAHAPTEAQRIALQNAEREYCLAAYNALLTRIGTSFAEIRLARSDPRAKREALADRLGIDIAPLGAARPDYLDALYLDPTVSLTENALDRLFGLRDTNRFPLAEHLTLGDPEEQILRCHLDGVEWGRNTDNEGMLYVTLTKSAQGMIEIELYSDANRTHRVAVGGTLTNGENTRLYQQSSGLDGSVTVLYSADSKAIALLTFPRLVSWRFQHLRSLWEKQDRPADAYTEGESNEELQAFPQGVQFPPSLLAKVRYDTVSRALMFSGVMQPAEEDTLLGLSVEPAYQAAVRRLFIDSQRPPIIDPDVIGPDDFRAPFRKANASDPDQAFDIWIERRDWVDARMKVLAGMTRTVNGSFAPDLDGMMGAMYGQVPYGAVSVTPWANTTPLSDLDTLSDDLAQGVDVETATRRIQTDLGLTIGRFGRLMEIRAKDQAARDDVRDEAVRDEEWGEGRSILVQAQKVRLSAAWRQEEQVRGIALGPKDFWPSLHEPQVGDWPPVIPNGQPLIDPDTLPWNDLPEATAGELARKIWQSHAADLRKITRALQAERKANGFDGVLRRAFGSATAVADVTKLQQDLQSTTPAIAAAAKASVTQNLHLTVETFNRLMAIKAKADDPARLRKPSAAEWTEVYTILVAAYKERQLFPIWVSQSDLPTKAVYWSARKARLPLWRATVESRQEWQTALRNRSAAPIIDPDLIDASDLKHPVAGEPAFEIWQSRRQWIDSLHGSPVLSGMSGLDFRISEALGIEGIELESLDADQAKGNTIDGRLAQLCLSPEAFSYLVRVRRLVESTVLESEWEGAYAILTQVSKSREFARWREAEATQHIVLGPDQFQIPDLASQTVGPQTPLVLPAWRATRRARLDWQDALQSRIDQQNAVVSGLQQAVDAAEGTCLSTLRDAAVVATDAPFTDLTLKATWLTERLLIDARESACRKTTRIEQALETLQDIFFALRTSQFTDSVPLAASLAGAFDEEWKWMGSYANWRAAILVWMYPENVLQPSLRKWQTPGFRTLVRDVRANPSLSPEQACKAARDYSDYFRDVCTLVPSASCEGWTSIPRIEDCQRRFGQQHHWLVYLFGRGGWTNRVYWSVQDKAGEGVEHPSGHSQTFWALLPGVEHTTVSDIVGAETYWTPSGARYLYVFLLVRENGRWELLFTRYDLGNAAWDTTPTSLDLPPNSSSFEVILMTQDADTDPPRVRVRTSNGSTYERALNKQGRDWAVGEWAPLVFSPWARIGHHSDTAMSRSLIAIAHDPANPDFVDVFATGEDNKIHWAYGDWHTWLPLDSLGSIPPGAAITAVRRTPSEMVLFVVGQSGELFYTQRRLTDPNFSDWNRIPNSVSTGFAPSFTPGSEVTVLVDEAQVLHLFAVNTSDQNADNHDICTYALTVNSSNNSSWLYVGNIKVRAGTVVAGVVDHTASSEVMIHLFAVSASDGKVCCITYQSTNAIGWNQPWTPCSTSVPADAPITAVWRAPQRADVFVVGKDGGVYQID
jgi:hypothetical protein